LPRSRQAFSFLRFESYCPKCASADRSGPLDTSTIPLYGVYISNIKNIALDTDTAVTNHVAATVPFRGA
jgi:hypothetical protein